MRRMTERNGTIVEQRLCWVKVVWMETLGLESLVLGDHERKDRKVV